MRESEFINSIKKIGGSVYIVGGWVRDRIRGVCPKDRDYVLCGLREEDFLGAFPSALRTGRAFPVYRLELDGEVCEIAFARTERKEGSGYRGFAVAFSPDVTIEDDLWRRDTTMNSIAYSPLDGSYVDPFGGADDIGARTIRATSRHFLDDPVRALRAARQAAQLEFGIEPGTIAMMGECRGEIAAEPPERLVRELESALGASRPSLFFRALKDASLLDAVFPEIAALIGKTQPPCYHPEGDAFEHTMMAVDCCASLTERIEARFAALAHDLGKGLTPEGMLPRHQGHDKVGLDALKAWNNRMMLPARWLKCAGFAISEHMSALDIERP